MEGTGGIHEWAVSLIHQIYFSGFAVDCTKWTMNGADTSEPPDDHHAQVRLRGRTSWCKMERVASPASPGWPWALLGGRKILVIIGRGVADGKFWFLQVQSWSS